MAQKQRFRVWGLGCRVLDPFTADGALVCQRGRYLGFREMGFKV